MRFTLALAATVLVAALGCGDSGSASAQADAAARGALVKVVSSQYGKVIADSKGEALYLFTKDRRGPSRCYGACAAAWPPVLTKGKPRAGKGITASRLGTTRRSDGKLQVTYKGQPLYYYVHDKPGVILCQNVAEFGGDWLVVAPSGRAIR
jgi:predicted lipoprotein with Yx(FWY)xxD motif